MGCDIHFHTEVKINGKWEHMSAPSLDRWYAMFEKMAGVRGDEANAISPPKGLPSDVSLVTAIEYARWGSDAHSASWFDDKEIKQLEDWLEGWHKKERPEDFYYPEQDWGYCFGAGYGDFSKYDDTHPAGVEDVRFVFWFDN